MALTFAVLVPAVNYAFDLYDEFLAALPLIPASALAGFSIARLFSFAGTLPNAKYSASAMWLAASQWLFFAMIMTAMYGADRAVPEVWFIIFGGGMLVFMKVPDAAAQRDPQFDKIDLALPFIAAAVLCVGVRIVDDTASLSSSPLWLFYAHVQGLESTTAQTPQTIIVVSALGWQYFC